MEVTVTQVTFLDSGEMLVVGVPVDDATKVVVARAPETVALSMAMVLAGNAHDVVVTIPSEAIVEIREL